VVDALGDVLALGVAGGLPGVGVVVGLVVDWPSGSALAGMPNADAGAQAAASGVPGRLPARLTGGMSLGLCFFATL
jgi:hypothetical protein